MQEALRTYLELAMGVTDASRKKVKRAVKDAVGRSGATADQVRTLTSDLLAANSANREALSKLVKFEVDRALGVVGLATAEEVSELTSRVRDLERQLRDAKARTGAAPAKAATKKATPARKTVAKKATAKKTTAASATTKKTTAAKAPAKKTTAKKTTATKAPASKAAARKAPAKNATTTSPTKAGPSKAGPSKASPAKAQS